MKYHTLIVRSGSLGSLGASLKADIYLIGAENQNPFNGKLNLNLPEV